jgi:peptidoglycan hydrolase-like protein with peptidoglycan-binding domain
LNRLLALTFIIPALGAFGVSAAQAQQSPCPGGMSDAMASAFVRTTQAELNLHGYDAGPPDGALSPKTQNAIREYEQDAKLPVDGCVSQGLVDHLQFVLPRVEKARGPRSKPDVLEVQTELTRRGFYVGAVDGVEGMRTRDAVRRFQEAAKLPVTGNIDETVAASIKSADPKIRGDTDAAAANQ